MRYRLAALSTVALLTTIAAPALAQTSWSGPYVGGAIGYAKTDSNDSETVLFDKNLDGTFGDTVTTAAGANAFSPGFCGGKAFNSLPAGGCSEKDDGIDFNVRAGYDWQFGPWVVGGVAEFGVADVEDAVAAFSTTPAQYTLERDVHSVLAGRVRGGYAVGDYLPYVTAGLVRAKINNSFSTTNTANTFGRTGDEYVNGYQLGAGVEKIIMPGVSLGLEYMFTRLDDDGYRVRAGGPAPATNPFILTNASGTDFRRSESDLDYSAFRATIAYRF